jgi:hypothetical protein
MAIKQSVERQLGNLRTWNIEVVLILAIQAIMIAVLINSFSLHVTATFMDGPQAPYLHFTFCSISQPTGVYSSSWLFQLRLC